MQLSSLEIQSVKIKKIKKLLLIIQDRQFSQNIYAKATVTMTINRSMVLLT